MKPPAPQRLAAVEPDDAERFAPVTFKQRGMGSVLICLDHWEIGELQIDRPDAYQYRVLLPGLRAGWRRPVPYVAACDNIVAIVREWIDAAPAIAAWLIKRERERVGDRRSGDHRTKGAR